MKHVRRRLTYANVISTLALFCVLSGVAWASGLPRNSVGTKQIKNGSVRGIDVAANTLTGADVKESSLTGVAGAMDSQHETKLTSVSASNASSATAMAAATKVPLITSGPLSVYGKCWKDTTGNVVHGEIFIATTTANAMYSSDQGSDGLPYSGSGSDYLQPATAEADRALNGYGTASNNQASGWGSYQVFDAVASDGHSLTGRGIVYAKNGTPSGGNGMFGAGDHCLFEVSADVWKSTL